MQWVTAREVLADERILPFLVHVGERGEEAAAGVVHESVHTAQAWPARP
jgi:hypothetical protein